MPQTKKNQNAQVQAAESSTKYTVSDGELVLILESCEEGGYCVTCPFDPALITQGETLEECFEMARDAAEVLRESREESLREGSGGSSCCAGVTHETC